MGVDGSGREPRGRQPMCQGTRVTKLGKIMMIDLNSVKEEIVLSKKKINL